MAQGRTPTVSVAHIRKRAEMEITSLMEQGKSYVEYTRQRFTNTGDYSKNGIRLWRDGEKWAINKYRDRMDGVVSLLQNLTDFYYGEELSRLETQIWTWRSIMLSACNKYWMEEDRTHG